MRRRRAPLVAGLAVLVATAFSAQTPATLTGMRDPAFSPDGRRIAVSWLEQIWTMTPDGRDPRRVIPAGGVWVSERDPAWSPDGRHLAFAADTGGAFDLYVVSATGGTARRVTSLDGDERWPSWTRDGRLLFSHRAPDGRWTLHVTSTDGDVAPTRWTTGDANEWLGRVSPDGRRVVFLSDRDREPGDTVDVFVRALDVAAEGDGGLVRVTRGGGLERWPTWAPDSARVSFAAARPGAGTGVWVADAGGNLTQLASRHAGFSAWSPDGTSMVIATEPAPGGAYNGNPIRRQDDPPAAFMDAEALRIWRVDAPRPVDGGARALASPAPTPGHWVSQFDRAWQTLKSLYYADGPGAQAWDALRARYRPEAVAARSAREVEDVVDRMVAEQPLIKQGHASTTGVISSGHPLASAAGARMLALGGNIIDAIVATSFALGVVEPDASGIGGDGQAIVFMKGMTEPVVIEYKDMTPSRATPDNPKIFLPNGQRTASDGPTVANIPGVVAGLDLLFRQYGSGKVTWAQILEPAIALAEEGFMLDEALPTTIAIGRDRLAKYPEAARIFLPGGVVPKAGDRFVNADYAETLKVLAREGGQSFYRGSIARAIAADMEANGGIISYEDLAQYRAMERRPLSGTFREHRVFAPGPPVSTGLALIETLQILDGYTPAPGATVAEDAEYLHYAIEAWRVRDGGAQIADPERWPIDLGNHLDPAHARERFALINPAKAWVSPQGGRGRGGLQTMTVEPPDARVAPWTTEIQTGTTSFAGADADGNMVAITQTLSTWGGNFYVSKGLGFLYNDHFRGGRGSGYGSMLPLQRHSSTSVPTLVFGPGMAPRLAVGAAGNAWIPAAVYNIILNVVDGGLDAQRAIEAPRLLIGNAPGGSRVQIEDRLPRTLLERLESMGHTFVKVGRKGEVVQGYAALAVIGSDGTVTGGAEPRRSHGAR